MMKFVETMCSHMHEVDDLLRTSQRSLEQIQAMDVSQEARKEIAVMQTVLTSARDNVDLALSARPRRDDAALSHNVKEMLHVISNNTGVHQLVVGR